MTFEVPEEYRLREGPLASDPMDGNNGAFIVPHPDPKVRKNHRHTGKRDMTVLASQDAGWEHVSVSFRDRCPRWEEMDYIKRLFWSDNDAVMQIHAPRSQWVNNHPYVLHLWKPMEAEIPLPPSILVGFRALNQKEAT